jgi:hypothetical protein
MSACSVRYRDFTKIKSAPKLGSVEVSIINLSPQLINPDFERAVKEQCINSLRKKGYLLSDKQAHIILPLPLK